MVGYAGGGRRHTAQAWIAHGSAIDAAEHGCMGHARGRNIAHVGRRGGTWTARRAALARGARRTRTRMLIHSRGAGKDLHVGQGCKVLHALDIEIAHVTRVLHALVSCSVVDSPQGG